MKTYKKGTTKPYSFLVDDATLSSDNPLHFRKNLLKWIHNKERQLMIRLKMKNYNMTLLEKLQKYRPYQTKLINMNILQLKKYCLLIKNKWKNKLNLLISLLVKLLKNKQKQLKIKEKTNGCFKILESSGKQLPSIKDFVSKERLNPEIIDEIERIEEEEKKADRSKMIYKGSNKTYDFRKFKTLHIFGNEISKVFSKVY